MAATAVETEREQKGKGEIQFAGLVGIRLDKSGKHTFATGSGTRKEASLDC